MNVEERLEEQEKEIIALKTEVEALETANLKLVEEKKIQEDKSSELEKNIASLEEKYQNEIAELKMVFEEKLKKLKEMIHTNKQKITETENEIMVSIHQMKVQLPLENWHDLLAFVPRHQLGEIVHQIGDRQFADILQSFLHDEVRKITLGKIRIIPPRRNVTSDNPVVPVIQHAFMKTNRKFANILQSFLHDEVREITLGEISIIPPRRNVTVDKPVVQVWPNAATNMPDWPMPENIKNFVGIDLNYLDMSILNFLGKFQENSLLENVNLDVGFGYHHYNYESILDEHILLQVLIHILPLISSIHSIQIKSVDIDLFDMVYNNNNTYHGNSHESQLLLKEMMAQTRILYVSDDGDYYNINLSWCCSWLYTPRNDGEPRMLKLHVFIDPSDYYTLIERIKKDFKMTNHAVSFFIYASITKKQPNIKDISFEDVKTNEKLVIKKIKMDDRDSKLFISRYPLNAAKSWIEANEKEISEWDNRKLDRKINMEGKLKIVM